MSFGLAVWAGASAWAVPEADAELELLRAAIAEWSRTEQRIVAERTAWQSERAAIEELMGLYRREMGLLAEELEQAGGSADEYAQRKDRLQEEIAAFKAVRDQVREVVERLRPRWLGLAFPPPLAAEIETERERLDAWERHEDPRPALQAMLSMAGAAEQFHRRFTRSTELRDGREVEVLYVGLTAAYYVDGSGGAGVGRPGPDGWTWKARPDLAPTVRQAFDQLDKRRPPELVELPLQVEVKGGQP